MDLQAQEQFAGKNKMAFVAARSPKIEGVKPEDGPE